MCRRRSLTDVAVVCELVQERRRTRAEDPYLRALNLSTSSGETPRLMFHTGMSVKPFQAVSEVDLGPLACKYRSTRQCNRELFLSKQYQSMLSQPSNRA
jgi:hypothetical protein